jgi:hypothetical protein
MRGAKPPIEPSLQVRDETAPAVAEASAEFPTAAE